MSSLSDPITFGLDVMVEAQRGMSTAEALRFLRTGELPDLSQPPAEDVEPPEPDVLTPDEALRFLAGEQLTAAAGFLVPSSLHCELPGREAFKFDPNQPRDSEGRWSEVPGVGVDVPKVAAPGKKVLPAVIYKKHADGAVVARRGNRRLRWDAGGKKFVAEEREGGDWVERDRLTKTAAYNEMKDGEWTDAADEPAPLKSTTPAPMSSPEPESAPIEVEPTTQVEPTVPTIKIPDTLDQSLVDEYLALAAKHTVSDKMYDASAPGLTPDENVRMYELNVKIGEQSDDTVRNRIEQLGKIEGALSAWRAEHGVTESLSELKKQLADSVRKHFAGKKIGMRVTEPALAAIIASGRVKSQFETNTSGGWNNPEYRAKYEAQWFGIGQGLAPSEASKVAPEKRPIYGYVMLDGVRPARKTQQDVLSFYGDIQIVLRDDVRKRTTAMFGDSLNEQNYGMPSPVDDPTWESFTPQPGFNPKSPVQMPLVQRDRDPKSQIFRQTAYAEAQIHNGVTVADIEEVIFPNEPSDAQREMLDAAGVAWRVVSGETAA